MRRKPKPHLLYRCAILVVPSSFTISAYLQNILHTQYTPDAQSIAHFDPL